MPYNNIKPAGSGKAQHSDDPQAYINAQRERARKEKKARKFQGRNRRTAKNSDAVPVAPEESVNTIEVSNATAAVLDTTPSVRNSSDIISATGPVSANETDSNSTKRPAADSSDDLSNGVLGGADTPFGTYPINLLKATVNTFESRYTLSTTKTDAGVFDAKRGMLETMSDDDDSEMADSDLESVNHDFEVPDGAAFDDMDEGPSEVPATDSDPIPRAAPAPRSPTPEPLASPSPVPNPASPVDVKTCENEQTTESFADHLDVSDLIDGDRELIRRNFYHMRELTGVEGIKIAENTLANPRVIACYKRNGNSEEAKDIAAKCLHGIVLAERERHRADQLSWAGRSLFDKPPEKPRAEGWFYPQFDAMNLEHQLMRLYAKVKGFSPTWFELDPIRKAMKQD